MRSSSETHKGYTAFQADTGQELKLAMQDLALTGRATPFGASLVVSHTFESAESEPLEAVYAFPLPRDAALRRFVVEGEGFSAHSELKPVEEAREAYETGIEEGHLSSLAQVHRDGVVNLSLGNIRPGERVVVRLELIAGVEARDGGFRFRFPFTLAPAYHAQAKAVELGEGKGEIELPEDLFGDVLLPTWAADATGLHRVAFAMEIWSPKALIEVSSPSHPLRYRQLGEDSAQVALATAQDVPNRDLVLDASTREEAAVVFSGKEKSGRGRFAVHIPSRCFGETAEEPRRVVFLLDRSASMRGACMEQAGNALRACLGALSIDDEFNIVVFSNTVEGFQNALVPGTQDNRDAAQRFLDDVHARGGTELSAGIQAAMTCLEGGGDIFLLTDGQVFGGETILEGVRESAVRVHCLGIGSAGKERFLTLLARETQGTSRLLTPRERVDAAALELFGSIGRPVACELEYEIEGLADARLEPAPARIAFSGTPVTVLGSCDGVGEGQLKVTWKAEGEEKSLEVPLPVEESPLGESLRLVQGARLITDLEARLEAPPSSGAGHRRTRSRLEKRLEKLSEEYGLASRSAALVAVVERAGDQKNSVPKTQVVPVGMPEDVEHAAYFRRSRASSVHSAVSQGAALLGSLVDQVCSAPGLAQCASLVGPSHSSSSLRSTARRLAPSQSSSSSRSEAKRPAATEASRRLDVLMKTAGRLEADGGLPGVNIEERVLHSLLALFAFTVESLERRGVMFEAHVDRLLGFLKGVDLDGLDKEKTDDVAEAMRYTHHAAMAGSPWIGLVEACVLNGGGSPDDAWGRIHKACMARGHLI